jgi:signal transduction histidine kinase
MLMGGECAVLIGNIIPVPATGRGVPSRIPRASAGPPGTTIGHLAMQHQDPRQRQAGILRASSRPTGAPPDPADGPYAIERITTLTHELGNLLDGSMRCLGLARRSLSTAQAGAAELDRVRHHLQTVHTAMERMADLVHAAMQGSASLVGSPGLSPAHPITITDAAAHAVDVLTPEAEEAGITFDLRIAPGAETFPCGPLYSVILNALRNAIESIVRADQQRTRGGHIDILIATQPIPGTEVDLLLIDVIDDGRGFASDLDGLRAFDFGVSTKPGGLGIGLALAREVVREVGGSVELQRRPERIGSPRPGAIFKVVYPVVRKGGKH